MGPDELQVAELAVLPDQRPWAEARPAPGAWGAWVGARRASAEAALRGWRVAGAGKSAVLAPDAQVPADRRWDVPAPAGFADSRSPPGFRYAPEEQGLYKLDVGPSAARSCVAAELRARLVAESEPAAAPQQWAELARAELARPGAPAA